MLLGGIQLFITPQTEGGRLGKVGYRHQKHMHMTTPTLTSPHFQTPTPHPASEDTLTPASNF